jgi:hypothetical protein
MRPKVVILTLLVAFGVLGAIVVFKGMPGTHSVELGDQTSNQVANADSGSGGTATAKGSQDTNNAGNSVAVSDQLRATVIAKEIEQIQQLQAEIDGTNNPTIIQALLDKMMEPEAEVRKAALEAVKEINDTNAIPGLEKAAEGIQDPRGKVAVMEVIDYLKLPSAMPDVQPPESLTNDTYLGGTVPRDKMNQHFLHKSGKSGTVQSSPPNATAN